MFSGSRLKLISLSCSRRFSSFPEVCQGLELYCGDRLAFHLFLLFVYC